LSFVSGNPCRICGKAGFKNARTRRQHERVVHKAGQTAIDSAAVSILVAIAMCLASGRIDISVVNCAIPLRNNLPSVIMHAMFADLPTAIATGMAPNPPPDSWTSWFATEIFRLPRAIFECTRNHTIARFVGVFPFLPGLVSV